MRCAGFFHELRNNGAQLIPGLSSLHNARLPYFMHCLKGAGVPTGAATQSLSSLQCIHALCADVAIETINTSNHLHDHAQGGHTDSGGQYSLQ